MHHGRVASKNRADRDVRPHDNICLHVIAKNVQSIRTTSRCEDFLVEIDTADFDIFFLCETWRSKGVGICMSQSLGYEAENISFHAYSCRSCSLMFNLHGRMFALIAIYFPTTWESEEAVDELYDLLTLVVDSFSRNAVVIIGGDFNATVGGPQASDDANIWVVGDTVQEMNVVPN